MDLAIRLENAKLMKAPPKPYDEGPEQVLLRDRPPKVNPERWQNEVHQHGEGDGQGHENQDVRDEQEPNSSEPSH